MTELVSPQVHNLAPAANEHWFTSRRTTAALLAAGILLGATTVITDRLGVFKGKQDTVTAEMHKDHMRDLNKDPRFRATTLTIMGSNFFGSGALAKSGKDYKLITVEHVAQPIYHTKQIRGREALVSVGFGDAHQPDKNSVFIPGVGTYDIPRQSPKPKYLGDAKPDTPGSVVDRFSEVNLPSSIKTAVQKAEQDGQLKAPEIAPLKAKFGEEFFMPLEETGKMVPFIFIDQSMQNENGGAILMPLALFDRKLDYRKGIEKLYHRIAQKVGIDTKHVQSLPQEMLAYNAFYVAKEQSEKLRFKDQADAVEMANWLPCHGDSGSPLLDKRGNIVAVISSSYDFKNKTAGPFGVVIRNGLAEPNRTCGYMGTFLTP